MTTTVQRYQPPANGNRPASISQATAVEQSRAIADVQAAVTVAQNCPRDMAEAEREMEYVCSRLDMAEQAFYQVTNRGSGPSVHLMRELARIWGNVDYGVKELARNDEKGESEVLATCWDMQKNTRSSRTFIVPHQRMRAGQRTQLVDLTDIYLNNQNVGARAVRECIQTILPRWFTEKAQDICRGTLEHGEGEPLQDRINTMVTWFRDKVGVSQQQMEARLGRKRGAWTAEDVAQMKIAGKSIMAGEVNRDELFPPVEADIITEPCEADAADEPKKPAASKLKGKVKSAAVDEPPAPEPGQGGENDASQGAEPSSGADFDTDSRDQESAGEPQQPSDIPQKPIQPDVTPGAPTASTPGQTDRVAAALAKAKKGGIPAASRRDLADDVTKLLDEGGCRNDSDRLVALAQMHGSAHHEIDPAVLTDTDLKKIRDTLTAWSQVGTLTDMVGRILDAADMKAESGQQTLDGTEGGNQ